MASGIKIDHEVAKKVMLKAGLKPYGKYINSKAKWKCKCLKCKKIIVTSYLSVAYHKTGCRHCNNTKKEIKNRRKDGFAIAKKANMQPLEEYKSMHDPWKMKCLNCNKTISPMLSSLLKGQGCKFCAVRGINLIKPSYVYLIFNPNLNAYKIGIGNLKTAYTNRLTKFNKKGWETYKVWNFDQGIQAWKIEQAVFKVIRHELKFPKFLKKEQMDKRLRGETETINADSITLLELEKIIKKVIKNNSAKVKA